MSRRRRASYDRGKREGADTGASVDEGEAGAEVPARVETDEWCNRPEQIQKHAREPPARSSTAGWTDGVFLLQARATKSRV